MTTAFDESIKRSRKLEASIVGGMLMSEDNATYCIENLKPDDFSIPVFRVAFDIASSLFGSKSLTLEALELGLSRSRLADAASIISEVIDNPCSEAQIATTCNLLREIALATRLSQLTATMQGKLSESKPEAILSWIEDQLEILRRQAPNDCAPEALGDVCAAVAHDALNKPPRDTCGLKCGIADGAIDELIGGFEPCKQIVLAARTSTGKTTLALSLAVGISTNNTESGAPLIVSTEVSQQCMARTILAAMSGIHTKGLVKRNLTASQREALSRAAGATTSSNIYMAYAPGASLTRIRAMCKAHKRRHGLPFLVIDLASKLRGHPGTEREQLASISAFLSELKGELDTCILACVQLSRSVFMSDDRRPELHHLKGCGNWEEDADMVLFLHRPGYYGGSDVRTELILAKNRDYGDVGNTWIEWKKATGRYVKAPDRRSPCAEADGRFTA